MMNVLKVLLVLLITFTAMAGDEHFKYVAPVDRSIGNILKWEDTESAARYSDYTLMTTVAASYIYAISEKEDRWKRAGTVTLIHVFNAFTSDLVKMRVPRTRPNNQNDRSFFSGHTSTAFASAGMICTMKIKHCPYAIALAGTVGYLRIAANWHWTSDVIIGAGVGYFNGRIIPQVIVGF